MLTSPYVNVEEVTVTQTRQSAPPARTALPQPCDEVLTRPAPFPMIEP